MSNLKFRTGILFQITKLIGTNIPQIKIPYRSAKITTKALERNKPFLITRRDQVIKWAAEFTESIYIDGIRKKKNLQRYIPTIIDLIGVKSIILIPLFTECKTIGLLAMSSKGRPSTEDLKRIKSISDIICFTLRHIRTTEALKKSEKKYRELVNHAQAAIYEVDLEKNRFVSANKYMCERTGYTEKEILSLKPEKLLVGDNKNKYYERRKYIDHNTIYNEPIEYEIRTKHGQKLWAQFTGTLGYDPEHPSRAIIVGQNITERKLAEKALRVSEERFRTILENLPIGVYFNDMRGKFLYGNKMAEKIIGYNRAELIGKNLLKINILFGTDVAKAANILKLNLQGKSTGPNEFQLITKDKTKKIVNVSTIIEEIASKKVVIGMVNLIDNSFYLDPGVKSLLGYEDHEIPNDIEGWSEFIYPEDKADVMKAAKDHLEGKTQQYVYQHRMIHKDGTLRWFLVRGKAIRDEKNNLVRMLGTDTDITEQKVAEIALR
jgi:PAS domain S-box-containing protein